MSDYDMSIHSNPDARAWAQFWVDNLPNIQGGFEAAVQDVDFMHGWFSNAMMAMHDHLKGQEQLTLGYTTNGASQVSGCPECGAIEVLASTPRTKYACGSSDYDQRPGSFIRAEGCHSNTSANQSTSVSGK